MNRAPRVCFAIVVLVLSAAVARADVVTDWNLIALQTIGITATQEAATDANRVPTLIPRGCRRLPLRPTLIARRARTT